MKLLDVVEVLHDWPEERVVKGQVGTIVDELDNHHVLVEFADGNGVALAIIPVPLASLRRLDGAAAAAALLAFQRTQIETKTGVGLDLKALREEGRK